MLLAAGIALPEHVFVHGFLLMRDASGRDFKMSKSLGNVLDPFQIIEQFGTDALRYYCLREVSFGQDGGVSTAGFAARYEGELANELGNLASRTSRWRRATSTARCPPWSSTRTSSPSFAPIPGEVAALLDRAELTARAGGALARRAAAEPLRRGAGALELAKDPARTRRLARVLATLVEGLRVVAVLLHPWMPARRRRSATRSARPTWTTPAPRPRAGRCGPSSASRRCSPSTSE